MGLRVLLVINKDKVIDSRPFHKVLWTASRSANSER